MTLEIKRTRDGVPYAKLVEFYGLAEDKSGPPFRVSEDEILSMIEEIVEAREHPANLVGELRAERVKLPE